jgi:hypothetical protein
MASLADIPAALLTPERKTEFLTWLVTHPITYGVRRRLLSLWSNATGAGITAADHERIRSAPET